MEYVVLLHKYDVVKVGDLLVILHIYNKFLRNKTKKVEMFQNILIWRHYGQIFAKWLPIAPESLSNNANF